MNIYVKYLSFIFDSVIVMGQVIVDKREIDRQDKNNIFQGFFDLGV